MVSDLNHEIAWLTRNPTVAFPLRPDDLAAIVAKYDVAALYEHPLSRRDWPWISEHFTLVAADAGRLWVRDDRLRGPPGGR